MCQLLIFNFRNITLNKPIKAQGQIKKSHTKCKEGLQSPQPNKDTQRINKDPKTINQGQERVNQGGITHSFKSYGEPITLSSLHKGLYLSCGCALLHGRSCTIKFHTKVRDQGSTHAPRHEHPGPSPGALDISRVFKCLVTNQDSHAQGMVTLAAVQGP